MTLNKLASILAKIEGKKHQASVADIRELLKIMVNLEFATAKVCYLKKEYIFGSITNFFTEESQKKAAKLRAKKTKKTKKRQ